MQLLVYLAAFALTRARAARLGSTHRARTDDEPTLAGLVPEPQPVPEVEEMIEALEAYDDAPEVVRRDDALWGAVEQHAGGALLAINERRADSMLGPLGELHIRHAHHLQLGLREGFRICLTVAAGNETRYVQIDTESRVDEGVFDAIFNVVPVMILGAAGADTFEGKNDDNELDAYPCDAASDPALLGHTWAAKTTSRRATGHVEEEASFKMVDTFRKTHLKLTNAPGAYDFYAEYPECRVPVHDQGTCGSCYAFATLVMIDGRACKLAIEGGGSQWLSSLEITSSEQDVVSCSAPPNTGYCNGQETYYPQGMGGCTGGNAQQTIAFVRDQGLVREQCFPYTSGGSGPGADHLAQNDGVVATCAAKTCAADAVSRNISPPRSCSSGDVACIKAAILDGPVYAGMQVNGGFMRHADGDVVTGSSTGGGHAVNLYGWGMEDGAEYWLGQNSWGTHWGDEGRFKIQFGALRVDDNVVWSDPRSDAAEHYGGVCIRAEEVGGTCIFTNECAGAVTARYAWHRTDYACRFISSRTSTFLPDQSRSVEEATGCAVTSEEDEMCTNSVPESTMARVGWGCDRFYSYSDSMCDYAYYTSASFRPREVCCSCGGGTRSAIPRPDPREWRPRSERTAQPTTSSRPTYESWPSSQPSSSPTSPPSDLPSIAPTEAPSMISERNPPCTGPYCKPGPEGCTTGTDVTEPIVIQEGNTRYTYRLSAPAGTPCAPACDGSTCPAFPGSSALPHCRWQFNIDRLPKMCALYCNGKNRLCPDSMTCENRWCVYP